MRNRRVPGTRSVSIFAPLWFIVDSWRLWREGRRSRESRVAAAVRAIAHRRDNIFQ